MADLIAIRVMPVNLTNSLAVPRPPPPPPPPPSHHMKRSASRNLFGAPKRGEIDALVEREQKLHRDQIFKRYNIVIEALDDHEAAADVFQKQQNYKQQHSSNVGDNQQQQHHHQQQQYLNNILNKCNSIKNINSNNKQQISSSSSSSAGAGACLSPLKYAEPSTFSSLAMEREQRPKPYERQRTIKDYSYPVRKSLMQRRQETTPPNVPRCLAAASGSNVNGANKSQAIKKSSVTKNITLPTSPLMSSSSQQTLSNENDSTTPTTTNNSNNNNDNTSNNKNVVVSEVSQTSQSSSLSSSSSTITTKATQTPPPTAKCNETS